VGFDRGRRHRRLAQLLAAWGSGEPPWAVQGMDGHRLRARAPFFRSFAHRRLALERITTRGLLLKPPSLHVRAPFRPIETYRSGNWPYRTASDDWDWLAPTCWNGFFFRQRSDFKFFTRLYQRTCASHRGTLNPALAGSLNFPSWSLCFFFPPGAINGAQSSFLKFMTGITRRPISNS